MKRWLVSGYFGFDNAGDEAMLAALAQAVQGEVEMVVLSAQPERTTWRYGVAAIPRLDLRSLKEAVAWADVYVSGPGGLFQDVTSFRSNLYYAWLIHLAAGASPPAPVAVYANSIGPLRRRWTRWLVRRALRKAQHLSVRDRPSLALLERLGFASNEVLLTADPVLLVEPVPRPFTSRARPRVGINVRPVRGVERVVEGLASALDRLVEETSADLVYCAFQWPDDLFIGQALQGRMRHKERMHFANAPEHPLEWRNIFADFDFFVGMRLHGLVFAALQGVPAFALAYDPKVEGFLMEFERSNRSPSHPAGLSIEEGLTDGFSSALLQAWHQREGLTALWGEGIASLRQRAEKGLQALLEVG